MLGAMCLKSYFEHNAVCIRFEINKKKPIDSCWMYSIPCKVTPVLGILRRSKHP